MHFGGYACIGIVVAGVYGISDIAGGYADIYVSVCGVRDAGADIRDGVRTLLVC